MVIALRNILPPANSLVVFEAAGRHMNFTNAARELSVTQSAVSRQIHLLEEHLGTILFQRQSRGLQLTSEGTRLHRAVTMGLEHIANVSADIHRQRGPGELTVATSVAFASYWLMARMAKFRAAHPEIELRLVAASPAHDLTAAGVDIAVRYGAGNWPSVDSIHLFGNDIWPVCSPQYLKDKSAFAGAEDLLNETLLHLSRYDRNWVTWKQFLDACGVSGDEQKRGLVYDNHLVLMQSALRGDGIALCGRRLAEDFIAHGDLVRPVRESLKSKHAFHVLWPKTGQMSNAAQLFRDWLISEANA